MKNKILFYLMFSASGTIYGQPGKLDICFNNIGTIIKDIDGNDEGGDDIAIGKDGVIFVTGNSGKDAYVISYNPDGTINNSFGDSGLVRRSSNDFDYVPNSIGILPDYSIIISGYTWTNITGVINIFLMKFTSDGKNDLNFGTGGTLIVTLSDSIILGCGKHAIQNDGKILVAGFTIVSSNSSIVVFRYHSNGTLDKSFGTNGMVLTDFGGDEVAYSIAVQYDNKILVSGTCDNIDPNSKGLILLRYCPDGKLDSSFAEKGYTFLSHADLFSICPIGIQDDKKILLGGVKNSDFKLARFDTNGTFDNSFGVAGVVTTDFGKIDQISDITLQEDNKIVVVGSTYEERDGNLALARYNTDGSLDSSFGNDGKVIFKYNYTPSGGWSVALQTDEKIVVSGFVHHESYDILIARFLSNNMVEIRDMEVVDLDMGLYYPNPVKDRLELKYSTKDKSTITLQLLDINGKLIETFINKAYRNPGDHTEELILPVNLNNGAYLIRMLSDSDKENKMFKIMIE